MASHRRLDHLSLKRIDAEKTVRILRAPATATVSPRRDGLQFEQCAVIRLRFI